MTCAKKIVTATLVTASGEVFRDTNYCFAPQVTCPRLPGEGYEKCISVCRQPAHAEVNAIRQAGFAAHGSIIIVDGIDRICDDCRQRAAAAGVAKMYLGTNRVA